MIFTDIISSWLLKKFLILLSPLMNWRKFVVFTEWFSFVELLSLKSELRLRYQSELFSALTRQVLFSGRPLWCES
jgi:hypothetical protein